jgi:antitoxin (DNA-binding transcriptional repressor) of toxin-antitoxin stability system
MAHANDVTIGDLQEDASAVLRRAEHGEHLRVLVNRRPVAQLGPINESDYWVDSKVMDERIRDAQADPALRSELDDLQPDTIADL